MPTANETPLSSIRTSYSFGGDTVNVFFAPAGFSGPANEQISTDDMVSEGFNAYEKDRFGAAFNMIERYVDLAFKIVEESRDADFTLLLDTDQFAGNTLGYFYLPNGVEQFGVFNGDRWDRTAGGDLELGGLGFKTIVHELLHGLGLDHPHDGSESDRMDGVTQAFDDYGTANLNQGIYTMMTYNDGYNVGPVGSPAPGDDKYGRQAGPMALDIAVLQDIYGANTRTNVGDTVYKLDHSNDAGTHWSAIWDAGGIDTIKFEGGRDAVVDLRAATLEYKEGGGGFVSAANGIAGGFTIAAGVAIENAIGGGGDDVLRGNDANNALKGGGGNDWLTGSLGHDVLDGNAGNDRLDGGSGWDRALYVGTAAVTVNLGLTSAQNTGYGWDTLTGIERLTSGSENDRLTGNSAANSFSAGAGDDVLMGRGGADRLLGEGGRDVLRGGDGTDTLNGGLGNDTIYGGDTSLDRRDIIYGGGGDDQAEGGYGNDALYGGTGNDNLSGGHGVDEIHGQEGNDTLNGSAWSDLVFGGDGFDFINGGYGNDRLNGGAGGDKFYHLGVAGHGSDWIQDYTAAEGDVLIHGGDASRDQFQVNFATTGGAGDFEEAFVIYRPTGQILWALVDGAGQNEINLQIGGQNFDLL